MIYEYDADEFDAQILEERSPTAWMTADNLPPPARDSLGHFLPVRYRPCGTETAYHYHIAHGEPVDRDCRLAGNAGRLARKHRTRV